MFFSILYLCIFNSLILLTWFKSEAFVEWFSIFRLAFYTKVHAYRSYQKMIYVPTYDIRTLFSYPEYLAVYYPNFFTKLLSCHFCTNFWTSFLLLILFRLNFYYLPVVIYCNYFFFLLTLKLNQLLQTKE